MRRDKGMVFSHCFRCHPAELVPEMGDMIKFTATENDSSGKVKNFLNAIEVLLATITKYGDSTGSVT